MFVFLCFRHSIIAVLEGQTILVSIRFKTGIINFPLSKAVWTAVRAPLSSFLFVNQVIISGDI